MVYIMNEEEQELYTCPHCNYKCSYTYHWIRHLHTTKHKKLVEHELFTLGKYECDICNKSYTSSSGLWYHKKTCSQQQQNMSENTELSFLRDIVVSALKGNPELQNKTPTDDMKDFKEMFMCFMKSNQELQTSVIEAVKHNTQVVQNTQSLVNNIGVQNNNNNIQNNHFNLNFFLNEQCKDAININEFIDSIEVSIGDLEHTAKHGYVDGITNIIFKNLKKLDRFKRPIHCSDFKREILYIKHNNKWEKDLEDKRLTKQVVRAVAVKNIGKIKDWIEQHPGCTESDSINNNMYHKVVTNAMSGDTEEIQQTNMEKVIRNLAKEVIIIKK